MKEENLITLNASLSQLQMKEIEEADKDPEKIYGKNGLFTKIINDVAEDMTRSWFDIEIEGDDGSLEYRLQQDLDKLEAKTKLYELIRDGRLYGTGIILMIMNEVKANIISKKINAPKMLKALNVINVSKVEEFTYDDNIMSENYKALKSVEFDEQQVVSADRLLVYHNNKIDMSTISQKGTPMVEVLASPLRFHNTVIISLGKLAHKMNLRTWNTDQVDMADKKKFMTIVKILNEVLSTNDVVPMGKDERLESIGSGNGIPSISEMVTTAQEFVSTVSGIPKSILFGRQEGGLGSSGGEYDHITYYMRITGKQERELRPILRSLIQVLLNTYELGEKSFKIKFKPLFNLTEKEHAEIEVIENNAKKLKADTLNVYYTAGALSSEDMAKIGLDDGRIEELNNSIAQAMEE